MLDSFTIKHFDSEEDLAAGQVIGSRNNILFLKITQNCEEILCCYRNTEQYFSIKFGLNRMIYKILMNTMEWVKEHRLFGVLINNEIYDQVDHSISKPFDDQKAFNCPSTSKLNYEQKVAVQHIVFDENIKVPMLLHGPPGKFQSVVKCVF